MSSGTGSPSSRSLTIARHPGRRTTTRSANGSKASRSTSAGGRPSTAAVSTGSPSSAPSSTAGSSPTTPAAPTTATTCAAAHHAKSSTPTERTEQHDPNQQGPTVTSTRNPEALGGSPTQPGLLRVSSHWVEQVGHWPPSARGYLSIHFQWEHRGRV